MDQDEITSEDCELTNILQSRLGKCEVCGGNPAKYTCPACEVKTCCLKCVNIHKKELDCSGMRNRVKFKPLKAFTNMDLQSDYIFLESTTRAKDDAARVNEKIRNMNFYSLTRMKIKSSAFKKGIKLHYLPKNFSKHIQNTTYLDWKTNKIYWKIEWVFPEVDTSYVATRVAETQALGSVLSVYIDPKQCKAILKHILKPYQEAGEDKVEVLLKLEKVQGRKFCLLDKAESILSNLKGHHIIENPVFYVILSENMNNYDLVQNDPQVKETRDCFSNCYKGVNFFMQAEELSEEEGKE